MSQPTNSKRAIAERILLLLVMIHLVSSLGAALMGTEILVIQTIVSLFIPNLQGIGKDLWVVLLLGAANLPLAFLLLHQGKKHLRFQEHIDEFDSGFQPYSEIQEELAYWVKAIEKAAVADRSELRANAKKWILAQDIKDEETAEEIRAKLGYLLPSGWPGKEVKETRTSFWP